MVNSKRYSLETLFNLKGSNVLVTGASGQLGIEIVSAMLALDSNVVAVDVDLVKLEASSKKYDWPSSRVLLKKCDIAKKNEVESLFEDLKQTNVVTDCLVNNAGVSCFESYLERREDSIDWVMNVNLKGTLFCIQEFIKHRIKNGSGGAIVNVASHYGLVSPDPRIYTDCDRKNSEIYGATKAGVIQISKYFAVHLAEHRIRTNAVSPGGIRNPENPQGEDFQNNYGYRCPMGRMAETNEIVGAILFLLSPAASYINGQNIIIDGGTTSW